ncbi:MAG: ribonuclease protein component [Pseudonocardiales bacterium]|nr:ribonuclease protein component [Pseudonocardiales bacterium]
MTRRGRRARSGALVVYLLGPEMPVAASPGDPDRPSSIGLIVGKSVGGSVVRHRVSRRLRAQLSDRLQLIPSGSRLVVRALPEAAQARSVMLGRELDQALGRLSRVPRDPSAKSCTR